MSTTAYWRLYRMKGCVAHVTGRAVEVTLCRNTTWLEYGGRWSAVTLHGAVLHQSGGIALYIVIGIACGGVLLSRVSRG